MLSVLNNSLQPCQGKSGRIDVIAILIRQNSFAVFPVLGKFNLYKETAKNYDD